MANGPIRRRSFAHTMDGWCDRGYCTNCIAQARSTFHVVRATSAKFGPRGGRQEIRYTKWRMNKHMHDYVYNCVALFFVTSAVKMYW